MNAKQAPEITASRRGPGRREDVLVCAARVFNKLGLRGATLADVAAELGVNLTSIRHHFPKRDDLVEAVVGKMFATNAEWIADAAAGKTPEERVRRLAHNMFDFRRRVAEGAEPDVIHFSELRSMRSPYSDRVWPAYADMFRGYRAIASTQHEIDTNRIGANARAHILLSQFLRAALWLPAYQPSDFERLERNFVDILLNGLSADRSWTPRPIELQLEAKAGSQSAEAFLAAATQIINQEGYRGASVQRIAASLNVTKGSFYHHINAKDDLVAACCERTIRIMTDAQLQAARAERRGLDQGIAATTALVRLQRAPGALVRTSALVSMDAASRAKFAARMDAISLRFTDMISDAMIDKSGRICDARIAGSIIMSFVSASEEAGRWVPGLNEQQALDIYTKPIFLGLLSA